MTLAKPATAFPGLALYLVGILWAFPQTPQLPKSEVGRLEFELVAPGIEYAQIRPGTKSHDAASGPWLINLLRIDLKQVDIRVVHALDETVGLETTSSMAARHGAIAAVNGGFFKTAGTYRGDPAGAMALEGRLLSEPVDPRAAVGLLDSGDGIRIVFGRLKYSGWIETHRGAKRAIDGINRQRVDNELIVYTPEFHRTTLTTPEGVEVIVRRNRVTQIHDGKGSSTIPEDGYIISATGTAREWARQNLRVGAWVRLNVDLVPVDRHQEGQWERARYILGGGPQLVKDGRVEITADAEKVGPDFVNTRHPRTAIAMLDSGKLLLVTVDGRQPEKSVGMSLAELANLLLEFGAKEAINLDGGGSTTMVVKGKVVNSPSDQTGERPVSDAILILPKRQR